MKKLSITLLVLGAALVGSAETAWADLRQNELSKDVAVRHRRLLVKNRFEVTPLFETTINADFRHIIGGGLKLEYHFSDMLSIGAIGVGSTAINTKLVNRLMDTLEDSPPPNSLEPSTRQLEARLNSMPLHGAVYISLTPWYGKLAAFSQAYVAFDFYFQAGLAFAQLKSDCPPEVCDDPDPGNPRPGPDDPTTPGPDQVPEDGNPRNDPPLNSGQRLGLYLGFGIHVFLNDFIALDLTIRDYAFDDNPSGADFNANFAVTEEDSRFLHHLFVGVGLSIMFPTKVKRTN